MPIDLKWVRTDPDQVREWQNLRRRRIRRRRPRHDGDGDVVVATTPNDGNENNDDQVIDLVDAVLRKDELSRNQLRTLEEYKRSLKQLQLRLRPTKTKKNKNNNKTTKIENESDDATKEQQDNNSKSESESPPTPAPSNIDRQVLMEEKKVLEEKIKKAEPEWKASLKDTQEALCKLASPVTASASVAAEMETKMNHGDGDDASPPSSSLVSSSMSMLNSYSTYSRSSIGMDLEQAWKQYTLRHFAAYLWVELPRGVPVVRRQAGAEAAAAWAAVDTSSSSSLLFSIDPDRAHELWGCCCDDSTSSSATTTTSCPICKVAASSTIDNSSTSSSSSSPKADDPPIVMLPAWIRLLTEFLPNKTIWGERELPRYTALWSSNNNNSSNDTTTTPSNICWLGHPEQEEYYNKNVDDDSCAGEQNSSGVLPSSPSSSSSSSFSLELVAIAASSVVDAREIQNDLVEELFNYYGGLLLVGSGGNGSKSNKLLKRVVAAPDLNSHEWSRVEIHVQLQCSDDDLEEEEKNIDVKNKNNINNNNRTLRLGWVSHWGDAASRACDMSFAGGGVVRAGGKNGKSKKYNNNKSTRNAATKEYVHIIQASVVDDSSSTWNKILYANSNLNANANANANCSTDDVDVSSSRRKEKRVLVDVSPVIIPYLIRPLPSNTASIPLEELVLDSNSKKKKKETVFGVRDDTARATAHNKQRQQPVITSNSSRMELIAVGGDTRIQDTPKFPPFVLPSSMSKEQLEQRIRLEKLSCPFDFLFE